MTATAESLFLKTIASILRDKTSISRNDCTLIADLLESISKGIEANSGGRVSITAEDATKRQSVAPELMPGTWVGELYE